MAFSENVRQARKREGLSQEEFAERIGVTQQMVSKYESGIKLPSLSTLSDIADVLNCSVDGLLGREKFINRNTDT